MLRNSMANCAIQALWERPAFRQRKSRVAIGRDVWDECEMRGYPHGKAGAIPATGPIAYGRGPVTVAPVAKQI
jgi:hypothetical protein